MTQLPRSTYETVCKYFTDAGGVIEKWSSFPCGDRVLGDFIRIEKRGGRPHQISKILITREFFAGMADGLDLDDPCRNAETLSGIAKGCRDSYLCGVGSGRRIVRDAGRRDLSDYGADVKVFAMSRRSYCDSVLRDGRGERFVEAMVVG